MRSAHPPERLAVELQSRIGPVLAQRGYRLVGQGAAGVAWRREMSGKVLAGVIVLGILALGGLVSGDLAATLVGVAAAASAGALAYFRGPATVIVKLDRIPGGTALAVSGRDSGRATAVAQTVLGPPPGATP